ncbi:MAG: UvrB/UvrC motif-containing protein [Candidatus Pacebacteria bacterium]|jgi:excinuclease ABC subunit C|nr:UvrB/UvrC motif-containing protein [Candidatus Paceibacterota bacterium]
MNKLTSKLPDNPGVYIFRGPKREILYIGKATSLKSRVASYFRRDLIATRGPILLGMVETAKSVDHIETDSVLEALILEAHLIKKHLPPYNTKEKDNKSFNYVVITKEDFPRIITMRGREIETDASNIKYSFGPFPQGSVLREALNIVRKIFPFRDKCKPKEGKPCFNAQIGLCPGVCAGTISKTEYAKTIRRIKLFFEGKKKTLISGLEREMKTAAKNLKFEEANRIKKMIFALNHIHDVALLKAGFESRIKNDEGYRIEAYDVAHISGTNVVGVMVVTEGGEPKKSDYRKFKIRTSKNDDNASLFEMLERRFNHSEWPMPKLIVVDGGKAQVNTAEKALKAWGIAIPVVGVVKDEHHRAREIIGDTKSRTTHERAILLANSEAHRFAIGFHRQLRGKIR